MFGFLNINKPKGITSHDVISKLRKITKIKQIGHAGTLDPMAEGVLPVAVGKASRLLEYLSDDKAYIADIVFGKISDTYDIEGSVEHFSDKKVMRDEIEKCLAFFNGEIEQIPPAHSAVHYKGKRLYELARQGIIPDDIPRRKVYIKKCELIDFDYDSQTAKLEIECSKGTYIRSIINDLGMMLNSGAVMSELKRVGSSGFCIQNSIKLDELSDKSAVQNVLINPLVMLKNDRYDINDKQYEKIRHGVSLKVDDFFTDNEIVALVYNNELCAISSKIGNMLVVKKVFVD